MSDTRAILPVNDKPPITVYKNYAYPLCILCADNSESDWLNLHFGNLYLMRSKTNYIWLDFLEPNDGFGAVLDYERTTLEELEGQDVMKLIRSTINENKYVTLFLDEFYMDHTALAGKTHHISEFFIYGYDDEKRELYTIGFNSAEMFGQLTYSYDSVIKAHDSLMIDREKFGELPVWVLWYAFSKIKRIHRDVKLNAIDIILNELEEYRSSAVMTNKLRDEIIKGRGSVAVYGANCQKEVIKSLYDMIDGGFETDYRHVHLIYEHKKIVLSKMHYVADTLKLDLYDIISRYQNVLKKMEIAKVFYLKAIIADLDADLYDQLKDEKIIRKIIKSIEAVSETEPALLKEFIDAVKNASVSNISLQSGN